MRPARLADVPGLQELGLRADTRFEPLGLIRYDPDTPRGVPLSVLVDACRAGLLFVAVTAEDTIAGFATCRVDDEPGRWGLELCLEQISVDPAHGRQGHGGALLTAVLAEATARSLAGVWLSTFRKVAFNGPFYRAHGFREVARRHLSPYQLLIEDAQRATMDVRLRCFMRRAVGARGRGLTGLLRP